MIKSIISKFMGCNCENKTEVSKVVCGCFKLTEQDLKPFNLSDPQVNSTITLYAKSDCDLFSGSLIIKFV